MHANAFLRLIYLHCLPFFIIQVPRRIKFYSCRFMFHILGSILCEFKTWAKVCSVLFVHHEPSSKGPNSREITIFYCWKWGRYLILLFIHSFIQITVTFLYIWQASPSDETMFMQTSDLSSKPSFASAKYCKITLYDMFISLGRNGKARNGKTTKVGQRKIEFHCFRVQRGQHSAATSAACWFTHLKNILWLFTVL